MSQEVDSKEETSEVAEVNEVAIEVETVAATEAEETPIETKMKP